VSGYYSLKIKELQNAVLEKAKTAFEKIPQWGFFDDLLFCDEQKKCRNLADLIHAVRRWSSANFVRFARFE